MAYYIKDKRQVNYDRNVKKAMDRLGEREEKLPRFAGPKLIAALVGFAIGAVMIIMGLVLGVSPVQEGVLGAGSIAFVSGIFSVGAGLIALISRQSYQTAPLVIATLVFIFALLLPVLHPEATKLMRGICLPNAAGVLLCGFYAKTSFDLIKKSGVKYKR